MLLFVIFSFWVGMVLLNIFDRPKKNDPTAFYEADWSWLQKEETKKEDN